MKERRNKSPQIRNYDKPENYAINAKICRLVEKFPCMYNRAHTNYLKKDAVDKAWEQISFEMNDSISSCKERWRNIRTSFARSINVNKVPACANRTKPYYLHDELQFLAKHITPGIPVARRTHNLDNADRDDEEIEGEDTADGFGSSFNFEQQLETSQGSIDASVSVNEAAIQNTNGEMLISENGDLNENTNSIVNPPKKRNVTHVPVTETINTNEHIKQEATESDIAFMHVVATDIKDMNFRQKLTFKRRIYEVISEIYNDDNSNHNNTNINASNLKDVATSMWHIPSKHHAYSANVSSPPTNACDVSPSTSRTVVQKCGVRTRSNANFLRVTMSNQSTSSLAPSKLLKRAKIDVGASGGQLKQEEEDEIENED